MKTSMIAVALVAALMLMPAGPASAQKTSPKPKPKPAATEPAKDLHPDVDVTVACRDCHESVTPEPYQQWLASAHGVNGVMCFVCHGGFENFVKKPPTTRCTGCHAEQTGSLGTPFMKGKDCFSCHPAHRLSPHPESPKPDPGVADKPSQGGAQ